MDQYVNVMNAKNANHTTSHNNVRFDQINVRVQKSNVKLRGQYVEHTENHLRSVTNQINSECVTIPCVNTRKISNA